MSLWGWQRATVQANIGSHLLLFEVDKAQILNITERQLIQVYNFQGHTEKWASQTPMSHSAIHTLTVHQ